MKKILFRCILLLIAAPLISSEPLLSQGNSRLERLAGKRLLKWENPVSEWNIPQSLKPDSVIVEEKNVNIYFPVSLSYQPFREESNSQLIKSLKKSLRRRFRKCDINVYTNGFATSQLIPNIYRKTIPVDSSRIFLSEADKPVFITRLDKYPLSDGLENDIIALWHSHGYYFDQTLDRWEWQRARLFGTVEDIYVMGYVLPFLTPMLENAGATVFLPRERDPQINEVIVDNDRSSAGSEFVLQITKNEIKSTKGFLIADTLFPGENPFKLGTSIRVKNSNAFYIPDIPAKGEYAVYISYPSEKDNSKAVKYTITHAGGTTSFLVNQTLGGETWIYLGTFLFNKGKDVSSGSVEVSSDDNGYVGLDAIKFGGGMGNVARRPVDGFIPNVKSVKSGSQVEIKSVDDSTNYTWKISGKPRFLEGARYFLQYAGMPDSLVYSPNNNRNDYNDDYQSRGNWVNYLMGASGGQSAVTGKKGLGLPVDLAFAFHSDAGVTPDSSIIGTLGIYSTAGDDGIYPDSVSRMAGRDYADIVQTQIVNDISSLYNIKWPRRGLWDKPYSEARKPDVPAMLLELLSHQNLADQRFGLDPRFRFTVSRAVYKGMLKFISYNNHKKYIVEPLPVTRFAITAVSGKTIRLSWQPVTDPLEPTAKPDRYRIYLRKGDDGFDNGVIVDDTCTVMTLEQYNTIYSFKVTAINEGGESFCSETLAAGFCKSDSNRVIVVNAFDRISGPSFFDKDGMAGIAWWDDRGVAYHYDISTVGDQYDFDRAIQWLDDDDPGWGASYADREGSIIAGNSFDYPYIHGKALMDAGQSFISVSNEAFSSPYYNTDGFDAADIILGEEKSTASVCDPLMSDFKIYTPAFIKKISSMIDKGKNILVTGSYVGTEIVNTKDTVALKFAAEYLHFIPRTGHAVRNGSVYSTDYSLRTFKDKLNFNTGNRNDIYAAQAPDAIVPADKNSVTAFRYSENNTSAAVMYNGNSKILVMGFPFETIISDESRNTLMKQIIDFFKTK
jgi:hypothetical protein